MKFQPLVAAASVVAGGALALAEPVEKPVSVNDCVQMALQKNLDIRIARYLPDLTSLDVQGAYGAYDPTLTTSLGYDFTRSPGTQLAPGVVADPVEQNQDSLNAGLNGLLPTGTRYNLRGNALRNGSERYVTLTNSPLFGTAPGTFDYFGGASIDMTQPLLKNFWIDSTRWTIQLGKKALAQDEQSLRSQIITTATDVLIGYYNLAAARENVSVQQKALELAERSLAENKKRVEVGAMAPLEEKQTEAQVASSRADLLSAQQTYRIAQNTLKRLLTDDFAAEDWVLVPTDKFPITPYPFNRQDSWHKALTKRPDVIQSQLELEKQQITLRFRKNQLFPQLDVSASYGASGRASRWAGNGTTGGSGEFLEQIRDRDFSNWGFGASISFPLSNRSERYRYKAAKLENERLLLRYKQLEQSVMVAVDNDILSAQTAFERVEATKQARNYAEQALDAEQKKLENGKSTSFVVLSLQRDLTQARSNELRALADYYRALAVLHQDEGSTLDVLGVNVER